MTRPKSPAKSRRAAPAHSARKSAAKKATRKSPGSNTRSTRKTARKPAPPVKPAAKKSGKATTAKAAQPTKVARPAPPPPPPEPAAQPPKKPAYYEAIALYEKGVRALQRHDFTAAAEAFRLVIQRYPDERELVERSSLYLRVCERETAERPTGPRTIDERVYAATMALNAGDSTKALEHVQRALEQDPRSDHAHYIMAVVLAARSESSLALGHLRRAVELNPENRSLARQDADLEALHDLDGFEQLVGTPEEPRRRSRAFTS